MANINDHKRRINRALKRELDAPVEIGEALSAEIVVRAIMRWIDNTFQPVALLWVWKFAADIIEEDIRAEAEKAEEPKPKGGRRGSK